MTSFLVRLNFTYDLKWFILKLHCIYSLYYLVLPCSLALCAAIVQFYFTYFLLYLVLHCISDLCAAIGSFCCSDTKLHALTTPTELVAATAYRHPTFINIQWWRSCSVHTLSTVDPPALPCPHRVHPTNQALQTCPYRKSSHQYAKPYDPVTSFSLDYLPLQYIL